MNSRLTQTLLVTSAAFALSLSTGCGDFPESPIGANLSVGEETNAQSYSGMDIDLNLPEEAQAPTIEEVVPDNRIVEAITQIQGPADWPTLAAEDNLEEGFADGIDGNAPEQEDEDDADDVEPSPLMDGFSDGDASSREWKELAWGVCRNESSELVGFKLTNSIGGGLYRAIRFACAFQDDTNNAEIASDFGAFMLGDATSCKTYDTFQAEAERICGTESDIVAKKVFGSCADSGGHSLYQSALFACKKPQN